MDNNNNNENKLEKLTEEVLIRKVIEKMDEPVGYLRCRKLVQAVLNSIVEAMENGNEIEFRECFSGKPIIRKPRMGYNFPTGKRQQIPQRNAYKLTASRSLKFNSNSSAWNE